MQYNISGETHDDLKVNPRLIYFPCRAIIALAHLVMTCDQTLYIKLIDALLLELVSSSSTTESSTSTLNVRTHIQAISAICRQAGHRFGDHVEKIVPHIFRFSGNGDDELREQCLQACKLHLQERYSNNYVHILMLIFQSKTWSTSAVRRLLHTCQVS